MQILARGWGAEGDVFLHPCNSSHSHAASKQCAWLVPCTDCCCCQMLNSIQRHAARPSARSLSRERESLLDCMQASAGCWLALPRLLMLSAVTTPTAALEPRGRSIRWSATDLRQTTDRRTAWLKHSHALQRPNTTVKCIMRPEHETRTCVAHPVYRAPFTGTYTQSYGLNYHQNRLLGD